MSFWDNVDGYVEQGKEAESTYNKFNSLLTGGTQSQPSAPINQSVGFVAPTSKFDIQALLTNPKNLLIAGLGIAVVIKVMK